MKRASLWLLAGIMAFGLLVRVWQLDNLPAILNRDEAALAYNALLLSETGKDEWGRSWPLTLESCGDFKLIGYPALLMPLFKLFGTADWVVRLPSAVFGTALIGLVYLLTRELGWKTRSSQLAALLVSVAPFSIFYSRMAFEANVALSLLVASLALMLSIIRKAAVWKYAALIVTLAAAVLTYNTPLLLLPFVAVWLWFSVNQKSRSTALAISALCAFVGGAGLWLLLGATSQKAGITIFTDETVWSQWTAFRASLPEMWQPIVGNRYLYFAALVFKNTLASFSPQFLVTDGGQHPWHALPGAAHLLGVVYALGLVGIISSIQKIWAHRRVLVKVRQETALLLLFIASLAPSVVTVDSPHATRSLLFLVLWVLFAVKGVEWVAAKLSKSRTRLWYAAIVVATILSAGAYLVRLFATYPTQQAVFQPGFDQVIAEVEAKHPDTPVAVVDPAGYQYVLLAWYLKLPAQVYFDSVIRQLPDQIGFRYGQQVTHYHFIASPTDRVQTESVLVQWSSGARSWQVAEFEE